MTIIEQFQKAKSDSREIEDGIVVTDSFAAVIDGSTSKGNFEFEGKTSGQIAMEIVSNAITTLPDTADIDEITNILTLALHNFYEEHQLLPMVSSHPENRPTCSIAIYSRFHHEVWLIGDTQCRIKGKTFDNPKLIDEVLSKVRADILEHLIKKGHSEDSLMQKDLGREYILPFLREQCHFQNSVLDYPFSYAVIDGFPVAKEYIRTIDACHADEIILASDGYPILFDTLAETEEYLQGDLEKDPMRRLKHCSTKGVMLGNNSFDDRTFLRIKI